MDGRSPTQAFTAALDGLVAHIKSDRSILAAILCGSLSHDTVWAKSDIDLVLVTIDDKLVPASDVALYADGVNVHAFLLPRAQFRKTVEGSLHQSFMHSFLAKGRLLYTHDDTIAELCDRLSSIGERDTHVQLLRAGTAALGPVYKAHKWLVTRGDLDYTALWLLYAATALAQIEVLGARQLVDREVIPQAMALNPAFFKAIYSDLLNTRKTRKAIEGAVDAVDGYLAARVRMLFGPVLDYLREAGETRSASEIESHFSRNLGVENVTIACEYLSDQRLIGKASTPVRVTKKSSVSLQELAFFDISAPDEWQPLIRSKTAGGRRPRVRA
jgi:predicted nucleotidyltransferase